MRVFAEPSGFLRKVYGGFDTQGEIEPGIWREVLRVINAGTVEGLTGKGSICTRLKESIGQTNRVFLNLGTTNPTNRMAAEIKQYFETNSEALEVLVAVGKKMVPVERNYVMKRTFFKEFRKRIEQ